MKKLSLTVLSLLALALIIYSCSKKDSIDMEQATTNIQLESPEHFVLAESESALVKMIKEQVVATYGEDYVIEITSITYTQLPEMTYADIRYTNNYGAKKNFVFYWPIAKDTHEDSPRLSVVPVPVPAPHCTGECFEGEDCTTSYDTALKIWTCDCLGGGGNNCKMSQGGNTLSCSGTCDDGGGDCEPAYNPSTGRLYCRCDGGSHSNCRPDLTTDGE